MTEINQVRPYEFGKCLAGRLSRLFTVPRLQWVISAISS